MEVFSPERKQQVLENLFNLATDDKSNTVAAIKLYLELANGAAPDETITLEHALELLRSASPPAECGGIKGGSAAAPAAGAPSQASPTKRTRTRKPSQS